VVLGSGGVLGIAWSIGIIAALAHKGMRIEDIGLWIGTSAGSVVAAKLANQVPVTQLLQEQIHGQAASQETLRPYDQRDVDAKNQQLFAKVQGDLRLARQRIGAWAQRLVLPCLTLAVTYVALLARVTRTAVSEALTEDYIRTARAKGISERLVLSHHALRNAAVPVATIIGVSAALLLGGVVVTETVFAIPGLGQLTVDAVLNRDFPVLQGVVLFFALVYVAVNLLVDLSYLVLDPRIRH